MSSNSSSHRLQKKSGKPQPVSLPHSEGPAGSYSIRPSGQISPSVQPWYSVLSQIVYLSILEKLPVTTPFLCIKSQGDFHTWMQLPLLPCCRYLSAENGMCLAPIDSFANNPVFRLPWIRALQERFHQAPVRPTSPNQPNLVRKRAEPMRTRKNSKDLNLVVIRSITTGTITTGTI